MKHLTARLLFINIIQLLTFIGCDKPPNREIPSKFRTTYQMLFTDVKDFYEIFTLERQIVLSEGNGFILGSYPYIAVGNDGRFLIYDRFTTRRVYLLDNRGNFIREIGKKGRGPGEYHEAYDTQFDQDGKIYIFSVEYKLIRYTSNGDYDNTTFTLGNYFSKFQFDASKNIYMYAFGILDKKGSTDATVIKYDPDGKELVRFAPHPKSFTLGFAREGGGIAIDSSGLIYHASPYEYLIQVFNSNGKRLDSFRGNPSDWKTSENKPTKEMLGNMKAQAQYDLSNSTVGRIQLLNNELILLYRITPKGVTSRNSYMDIYSSNGSVIKMGIDIPHKISQSFALHGLLYIILPAGIDINGRIISETKMKSTDEQQSRIQIYKLKK